MELLVDSNSTSSSRRLDIVETNGFKRVTHLSLKMACADDPTMVAYLSSRLYQVSRQSNELERALQSERSHHQQTKEELRSVQHELENAKYDAQHEKSLLQTQWRQDRESLTDERKRLEAYYNEKLETLRSELRSAQESSKNIQGEYKQEQADLKEQIESLRDAVKKHELKKQELESIIQRKDDEISSISEAKQNLRNTVDSKAQVEQENRKLYEDIHSRDSEIQRLGHLLDNERSKMKQLNEQLKKYENHVQMLKNKIMESRKEIENGNNIINRLREERRSLKAELKSEVSARKAAKSQVQDKNEAMRKLEDRMNSLNDEIASQKRKTASVSKEKEDVEQELQEAKQIISKNQQLIACLEKELNEVPSRRADVYSNHMSTTSNVNYPTYRKNVSPQQLISVGNAKSSSFNQDRKPRRESATKNTEFGVSETKRNPYLDNDETELFGEWSERSFDGREYSANKYESKAEASNESSHSKSGLFSSSFQNDLAKIVGKQDVSPATDQSTAGNPYNTSVEHQKGGVSSNSGPRTIRVQ